MNDEYISSLNHYHFILVNFGFRSTHTETNSTLKKIQTLSSPCNHPNKHVHLYLPLNVPSILHSARLQYLTLNLLLSQCVCVSLSCSAWLTADSSGVCQSSGQAQTHLPSSTCSRQWLS